MKRNCTVKWDLIGPQIFKTNIKQLLNYALTTLESSRLGLLLAYIYYAYPD